ncbi:hypothetical protein HYX16_03035 [Candidatus Woesearchaeota archaeon]|nr:hypothetical protein [Candidatus Woesearchaeota archaeon]
MDNKKFTEDGLPIVSEKTVKAFSQVEMRESVEKRIADFSYRLRKENPNLLRIINEFLESETESPDFNYGIMVGMQILYECLRKQSASYKLEDKI